MGFEGANRVSIVRGHEHESWHSVGPDLLQHFEPTDRPELNVEKQDIRRMLDDCLDGRRTVSALGDDLRVGQSRELLAQGKPAGRLVVHQDHFHPG